MPPTQTLLQHNQLTISSSHAPLYHLAPTSSLPSFLSTSLPSSPCLTLSQDLLPSLHILITLDGRTLQVCAASVSVKVVPAHRAQHWASQAPVQDCALQGKGFILLKRTFQSFHIFHGYTFILDAFLSLASYSSSYYHRTSYLATLISMLHPLSCFKIPYIHCFHLEHWTFTYDTAWSITSQTLPLLVFSFSFSPFLLTIAHSIQTVTLGLESYKYLHCLACKS